MHYNFIATGLCFFPGTLFFSTNKIDRHDITEILLRLALNTITITQEIFHFNKIKLHLYTMGTWNLNAANGRGIMWYRELLWHLIIWIQKQCGRNGTALTHTQNTQNNNATKLHIAFFNDVTSCWCIYAIATYITLNHVDVSIQ
jgi:hypothetical protein